MILKTSENAATIWDHPRACTADHLRLQSQGGLTTEENIVAACRECNNGRHWSSADDPLKMRATLADVWPADAPLPC